MRFLLVLLLGLGLCAPAAHANKLKDIYERALGYDAEFAAAQAAREAELEAWPQARASILPRLQAIGAYSYVDQEVTSDFFSAGGPGDDSGGGSSDVDVEGDTFREDFVSKSYGIELRQPLYRWDIPAILRQGKTRESIALLNFAAERKLLINRVITRYLDFLGAYSQLQFAQSESKSIGEQLERAKVRFEIGESAVTGLKEAQAQFDLAETRVIQAQTELDDAREALREITNEWYETLPGIGGELALEQPEPLDPEQWVDTALSRNARYLVARFNADIARDEIRLAEADYLPNLDLFARHQRLDDSESIIGQERDETRVGVELVYPIFAGGRELSEARERRHRYVESQALADQERRNVVRLTRQAYRAITQSIRRVQALDNAIDSARTALEATQLGFEVGERTEADVLEARSQLFSALNDHSQARYDYLQGVADLKLVAGVIDVEDLLRIDGLLAQPGEKSGQGQESESPPETETEETS